MDERPASEVAAAASTWEPTEIDEAALEGGEAAQPVDPEGPAAAAASAASASTKQPQRRCPESPGADGTAANGQPQDASGQEEGELLQFSVTDDFVYDTASGVP